MWLKPVRKEMLTFKHANTDMQKTPVTVIAGPTVVGKTALSVEIAKLLNAEIISADSMQIYKKMNIGTAKVTESEKQGVAHHLIDVVEPWEPFSVCDFVEMCKKAVDDITSRKKQVIITGGTGLYIDSFLRDIDFTYTDVDDAYREELEQIALKKGNEYIHNMLFEVDPESAKNIHPNNVKRVIRALEFYKTTGFAISRHNEISRQKPSPYNCCYICFVRDRQELYQRIDKRVDIMLEDGLIQETKELLSLGIGPETTAMQAIGYKEIIPYIQGKMTLDEAVDNLKRSSRRYAKRQLTWFGNRHDIVYINLSEYNNIEECAQKCVSIICDTLKKG